METNYYNATIRFSENYIVSLNLVTPSFSPDDVVGSCTIDNDGEPYTYDLVLKEREDEGGGKE